MQSYYLSLYVNCPPGIGLHCPDDTKLAAFKEAVAAGDITWHAFPHNAELEAGSAGIIDAGLALTHSLDQQLGVSNKTALSQRDVPGITRAVIPLLKKRGVNMVSVGVNGASMYPRVPKIFRWSDPISNEEVYAMWHPRGYGGTGVGDAAIVPGLKHALVTDWNGYVVASWARTALAC